MSKLRRKKNLKTKLAADPPKFPEKSSRSSHQTDLLTYFAKAEQHAAELGGGAALREGSLPSPDDAALPSPTALGSPETTVKDEKNEPTETNKVSSMSVEKTQKISDVTNKVLKETAKKKKKKKPSCNSQVTDFFPVRRSNRKPLPFVEKEKQQLIEEAILSGKEDGFEVRIFPEKGRGVVATRSFARGEFVIEYHGQLIDPEEAEKRETDYAAQEDTGCYMYYFKCSDKRYCIDATRECGRLGRLINHSRKGGNLRPRPLVVQGRPRLALFAHADIAPGEELLYDYGDRSHPSLEAHPWLAL